MDLREKLEKRLSGTSKEALDNIMIILQKYNLNINIKNFDGNGLVLFDDSGNSVKIVDGSLHNENIYFEKSNAEVYIIFCESLLAGWSDLEKLEDLVDRYGVNRKSLNPMPKNFRFVQICGHLSDHGGFYDGEFWECAGCGQRLVFNDKVSD